MKNFITLLVLTLIVSACGTSLQGGDKTGLQSIASIVTGDLNSDGSVDILDVPYFNELCGLVGEAKRRPQQCDLNFDGKYDQTDVNLFSSKYDARK